MGSGVDSRVGSGVASGAIVPGAEAQARPWGSGVPALEVPEEGVKEQSPRRTCARAHTVGQQTGVLIEVTVVLSGEF